MERRGAKAGVDAEDEDDESEDDGADEDDVDEGFRTPNDSGILA